MPDGGLLTRFRRAYWALRGWDIAPPPRATMGAGLRQLARLGIPAPRTIIDVGASDGSWSEMALNAFPDARCMLLEPIAEHDADLLRFSNAHADAVIVRKAAGAQPGRAHFYMAEGDNLSGAFTKFQSSSALDVDVTTLDAEVASAGLEGPILIKLDTAGYEVPILEGAVDTLARTSALVIEVYNYRIGDGDALLFWELCAYLADKGFRPIDLVDVLHRPLDSTFWQADMFFIRDTWPGFENLSFGGAAPLLRKGD